MKNLLFGNVRQMSKESIEIRPVSDVADARKLEEIQRQTWGMSEIEVLPGRFLHAMHFNGACLLGAYDGAELVGFVFGLLGTVVGMIRAAIAAKSRASAAPRTPNGAACSLALQAAWVIVTIAGPVSLR